MGHLLLGILLGILAVVLALYSESANSNCPPVQLIANEEKYLPVLDKALSMHWSNVPTRAVFGAQIRKETCASLTHSKCWSPYAELRTSREYGFGLGQLTITPRFDNFEEAKKLDHSLVGWTWENRYRAEFQLKTLVLMNRRAYDQLSWAGGKDNQLAFTFAAYNGGLGGVLSDRAVCRATLGCDPNRWYGHVEHTSLKSKVSVAGYGQSFFAINRQYVTTILGHYRDRYKPYFKECSDAQFIHR